MKLNVGKPVTGDELVGREREIKLIIETLKSGQSITLIAPRRFGKTSIMLEALRRLDNEGLFTGDIDIFTIPDLNQLSFEITRQVLKNRKLDEAFYKFRNNLAEILQNIKFRNEIQDAEFILSFAKAEQDEWEQLKNSIAFIDEFAKKHKKEICFAFDEFGDINKLDGDDIVKLFRSLIQKQENSVYIFTGSYESIMNQLFVTEKSPFYRMVKIIEPRFLKEDICREFIENKFKLLGIPFTETNTASGVRISKGHPYYIRLYIQTCMFHYNETASMPDNISILEDMLITEKNYIEKLWDEISFKKELRSVVLKIITSAGKPYTGHSEKSVNVSRAINELKGKGFVLYDKDKYLITDPLFEFYIKKSVLKLDQTQWM